MAKVNRHGSAAVLAADELEALLEEAPSARYRCLWALQRWTAARISEALSLRWGDLVAGHVTYRRSTTKTKATRQVWICDRLATELETYRLAWTLTHGHSPGSFHYLFPAAGSTTQPQSRQAADKALRLTCRRLGLEGVSTHSFRRTLATDAMRRGIPLPAIQRVTGHKSLGSLGRYLEPSDDDVLAAIGG